jgi:hypothetical protein
MEDTSHSRTAEPTGTRQTITSIDVPSARQFTVISSERTGEQRHTHQQACHKHFGQHKYGNIGALCRTLTHSYQSGSTTPPQSLHITQTSAYWYTEAEEGQERPDKSQIQNSHWIYRHRRECRAEGGGGGLTRTARSLKAKARHLYL